MGKNSWMIKAFFKFKWTEKVNFIKGFLGEKRYLSTQSGTSHVNMKELLRCALCPNMCKFECPTLRVTKKETYAPATKARISYFLERGSLDMSDPHASEIPFVCTNCDGCKNWCPMGISTGELLKGVRADLVSNGHVNQDIVDFVDNTMATGTVFSSSTFKKKELETRAKNAEVFYFPGCMTAEKKLSSAQATMKVLEKAGVDFCTRPEERKCCGGPLYTLGFRKEARELGEYNLELFKRSGARIIISDCPSCVETIRDTYKEMGLDHDFIVKTTTEYFDELMENGKITPTKTMNITITYHDPCITARKFNDIRTARKVLGQIPGLKIIEPFLSGKETQCCGMGGVSHVHHREISEQIGQERYAQLVKTGAKNIVTSCPACEYAFTIAKNDENDNDEKILDISEILEKTI
ncbi:MAG: (Fe-S)-binding protein [Promethearchaeota archaeon]